MLLGLCGRSRAITASRLTAWLGSVDRSESKIALLMVEVDWSRDGERLKLQGNGLVGAEVVWCFASGRYGRVVWCVGSLRLNSWTLKG